MRRRASLPRYELPDALVTPGFVDGHTHFAMWALGRRRTQLAGTATRAEAVARVAAAQPVQGWVVGQGWDANGWRDAPDRHALDAVQPGPVYLDSLDVHAAWVNTAALAARGRESDDPRSLRRAHRARRQRRAHRAAARARGGAGSTGSPRASARPARRGAPGGAGRGPPARRDRHSRRGRHQRARRLQPPGGGRRSRPPGAVPSPGGVASRLWCGGEYGAATATSGSRSAA